MQPQVGIFVSSTRWDLLAERQAVESAIHRMRATKFIGMEYFGSRDETTRAASLDEVDRCDTYVGIFGGRWGSGITEDEYRRAREESLKCFIYFKNDAGIADAERDVDQPSRDRLAAFKNELSKYHTVTPFSDPQELAAKVTADVYRWLFDEHLAHKLNAFLERDNNPTELQETLAAVRDLADLGKELIERLEAAGRVSSRLRDAYLSPTSVFERVDIDQFVGREWLVAEIERFVAEHDRGYFVIEANAGLGKTAFLAHYVQQRSCVYHFSELAPGPDGIVASLRSLAAQLVGAWQLRPEDVDPLLHAGPQRADFLHELLIKTAAQRDRLKPQAPIVIVVDALDEAGTPTGQNVLGLPRTLPPNVYFIVSQRPIKIRLNVDAPRQVFSIDARGEGNRRDQQRFLEQALASLTRDRGEEVSVFVEQLLAKSDGNWVYLHYIVSDILRGSRSLDELEKLPQGVWQFYAQFWEAWRDVHRDEWLQEHLPLLTNLAAIRPESASCELLTTFTRTKPTRIRELLEEHWRPFVVVTRANPIRYRLYHASLREFLEGQVTLDGLTSQESSFALSLAAETQLAHSRIADRYLSAWGGLENKLNRLSDPAARDLDERYGLRNVIHHLQRAGRQGELHAMLAVEWTHTEHVPQDRSAMASLLNRLLRRDSSNEVLRSENAWFVIHEQIGDLTGYLTDIAIAWDSASDRTLENLGALRVAPSVALEVRYALITASVGAIASRLPVELALALVDAGVWTVEYGLGLARQILDRRERAIALSKWVQRLPHDVQSGVSREAFTAAQGIEDPAERCRVLGHLLSRVRAELRDSVASEALLVAAQCDDVAVWRHTTKAVTPFLTEALLQQAIDLAESAPAGKERGAGSGVWRQLEYLEAIVECVPSERSRRAAASAEALASTVKEGLDKNSAAYEDYSRVARFLSGVSRDDAIAKAHEGIEKAYDEILQSQLAHARYSDDVLRGILLLAKAQSGADRTLLLQKAIEVVTTNRYPRSAAQMFLLLLPALDRSLCLEFVEALLGRWDRLVFSFDRTGVGPVAERCAELGLEDAAIVVLKKLDGRTQTDVLASIASRLDEKRLRKALHAVFGHDWAIRWRTYRDARTKAQDLAESRLRLAVGVVPRLAQLGHVDEAMRMFYSLSPARGSDRWKQMVEATAQYLPLESLRVVLSQARRIDDDDERFVLAARCCRHLDKDTVGQMLVQSRNVGQVTGYSTWGTKSSGGPSTSRVEATSLLCARFAELGDGEAAIKISNALFSENRVTLLRSFSFSAPYLPQAAVETIVAEARSTMDPLTLVYSIRPFMRLLSRKFVDDWAEQVLPLLKTPEGVDPELGVRLLAAELTPYVDDAKSTMLRQQAVESGAIMHLGDDLRGTVHALFLPNAPSAIAKEIEQQIVDSAKEFESDRKKVATYLRRVLPHVSGDTQKALIERATRVHGQHLLAELIPSLPSCLMESTVKLLGPHDTIARVNAAARFAELDEMKQALGIAESIDEDPSRANALLRVARASRGKVDIADLYDVWNRFLPLLARLERPKFLDGIGQAVDVLVAIGGEEAAQETVAAVHAAGRWWP